MPFKSAKLQFTTITFNKYGLHLRWPRLWIIILGIILIFLCLSIAGMEIGHTLFDLRRSTAFGGFIVFIPLMICSIFVLITAFKPRLILLRTAVILCCIMIILCMALILYDILVLIDPTRCFFFDCNGAVVNASNSTTIIIVTGWPLSISWPAYFQTNMNAKRIFQSIQILCAGLFILFATLYLLTYYIYRHIRLQQEAVYNPDRRALSTYDTHRTSPVKQTNHVSPSYPQFSPHHKITTYTIEGLPYTSTPHLPIAVTVIPKNKSKTFVRPRASSVDNDRVCTRCNREPRMILASSYERQNYFPYLCINCNNEFAHLRQKPAIGHAGGSRTWRP